MKIAIVGKMGSGKSTCAKYLHEKYNFDILSFGEPVKRFAREIFNDRTKNRKLIQDFAQKVKEIDNNVWINYLLNRLDSSSDVVIDDLRFPNEYEALKRAGFIVIKLNISDEHQTVRLKETYPDNFDIHINNRDDVSESYVDKLHSDHIYNITNASITNMYSFLDDIVINNYNIKDNLLI